MIRIPTSILFFLRITFLLLIRFESSVRPEEVVFDIDNSNRLDTGKYVVTLENEFGKDSGTLIVTVVDRPEPPVGPVVYQVLFAFYLVPFHTKIDCKLN